MKKTIMLLTEAVLICTYLFGECYGQSPGQNYVKTDTYTQSNGAKLYSDVTYYNGFGNPIQTVNVNGSGIAGISIITPIVYDAIGRQTRSYLPYISALNYETYDGNALANQASYYADDPYPYSENILEASPLNRVLEKYNVGRPGGMTSKFAYRTNLAGEVMLFKINTSTQIPIRSGYYSAGSLLKNTVVNEDNCATTTFKDQRDLVVLERVVDNSDGGKVNHDTYYMYDDFGNLRYVLPPELSEMIESLPNISLSDNEPHMKAYAYVYKYDHRDRCIEKRLPGADPVYMVYDKADRLVMIQDGNMRVGNRWIYTMYDNLDRPVCQSLINSTTAIARSTLQIHFNAATSTSPYDPLATSYFAEVTTLSENKYDSYYWSSSDTIATGLLYQPVFLAENYLNGKVIISEIMYDSPLNEQIATGNPYSNGEYIEIFNASSSPIELTMWKLTGGGSTEIYLFPDKTVIPANDYLIVAYQYNNSGFTLDQLYSSIDTSKVHYQRKIILSNSGETVSLIDNNGNVVDAIFYDGTSNKTKPDRLCATNEDYISGTDCVSLHRTAVTYERDYYAISSSSEWITAPVSPFAIPDIALLNPSEVGEDPCDLHTKGFKTYEKIASLDGENITDQFVERVFYYDYKGRVIQTVEQNHLGGISRYSTKYDFIGNILASHESHATYNAANSDIKLDIKLTEFTYDHRGRLLSETTALNDGEPVIIEYSYDVLGRLATKTYCSDKKSSSIPDYDLGTLYFNNMLPYDYTISANSGHSIRTVKGRIAFPFNLYPSGTADYINIENVDTGETWIQSNEANKMYPAGNYLFKLDLNNNSSTDISGYVCFYITYIGDYSDLPLEDTLPPWPSNTIGTILQETHNYNIQGWLTEKKSNVFDMHLHYYDPQQPDTEASYTGNITEWEWQHKGASGDNTQNTYAFTYDKLGRLTDSQLFQLSDDQWQRSGSFEEWLGAGDVDAYDKNGNILSLMRSSSVGDITDGFRYEYNGNQLAKLYLDWDDDSDYVTYAYDANGNCTTDGLNCLNLQYNCLDLTGKVLVDNQTVAEYRWLADGTKAGVKGYNNGTLSSGFEYLGSLIYRRNGDELELESTGFGGGRIMVSEGSNGNIYTPNYFINDHLGSTRAIVTADGAVRERNDYYAFGGKHENPQLIISDNRFRFSGKEDQSSLGLPYSDFGARMLDKKIGRWISMDPAEQYHSGYVYGGNNPINRIDSNGQWDITVHAYHDRAKHGYGVLVLSDRSGNAVYRARVRVEGSNKPENDYNKRDRTRTYSDTPTGTSKIRGWETRSDRKSFGPNHILALDYIDGEAAGRTNMHIHGGRQEDYINGEWIPQESPELFVTQGCIRMYDTDIADMKTLTDILESLDPEEVAGNVYVKNSLKKRYNNRYGYTLSTSPTGRIDEREDDVENDENVWFTIWRLYNAWINLKK